MKEKFQTLIHNGPVFLPDYSVKGYKINKESLSPLAEEMLWNYAQKLDTEYVDDPAINKNFYNCLKHELSAAQKSLSFPADFMPTLKDMKAKQLELKEAKKSREKSIRDAEKAEKDAMKAKYGWAVIDGKKQPLGAYMIEPPGMIMTRGKSPLKGMWKYRVMPEDVTINYIGPKESEPKAPAGHHWKEVIQNKNGFIIDYYLVNVGNYVMLTKRIMFGALSDVKIGADEHKFEKATRLCQNWNKIEKYINDGLVAKNPVTRESALISWLILRTGIRIGIEHDSIFENGTVGASSLLVKNINFNGLEMELNFIGKDSVPFKNSFDVPQVVKDELISLQSGKKASDKIFNNANEGTVNKFLSDCVEGCTAKLFRTAYGTKLLAEELQKNPCSSKMSDAQKKAIYDNACLEVSKKLNHQRNVAKNYSDQITQTDDKIKAAKDANRKTLDKCKEQLKKLEKDVRTAKKVYTGNDLAEKMEKLKAKRNLIDARVKRSEERIEKLELGKDLKKATKNISLGTAKSAYSSPKIAFSWARTNGVDIKFIYSASLQKKFSWAESVDDDYWKNYPNV